MNEWPKLQMFSVPLVSTWSFAEEFRLLVDCGDGASVSLGAKIHKIDTIALTHAHRDHIGGLLQLLNLRGGNGTLKVLFPSGSGSFPALAEFLSRFDPETSGKVTWIPIDIGGSFELQKGIQIEAFASNHMPTSDRPKSVGYRITRTIQKLREEFLNYGKEIPTLAEKLGTDKVFNLEVTREIAFCGDGLPIIQTEVEQAKCLVLESTFLDEGMAGKEHIHANLDQAFQLVNNVLPDRAIINHISSRYSPTEIMLRIENLQWPCPVKVVLPGQVLYLP